MSATSNVPTSQTGARVALGGAMTLAGIGHLTAQRRAFQAQVPAWVPVDKDAVVLGSGVVEIVAGVAFVALPRHRRPIGVALAGLFAAIFPGNVGQYVERRSAFGLDTDRKRLVRLFFQPALVATALWGAGLPDPSKPADLMTYVKES